MIKEFPHTHIVGRSGAPSGREPFSDHVLNRGASSGQASQVINGPDRLINRSFIGVLAQIEFVSYLVRVLYHRDSRLVPPDVEEIHEFSENVSNTE